MFDVEAVFIFPWATRLEGYGTLRPSSMMVFIARSCALGLVYAWRKGVLDGPESDRRVRWGPRRPPKPLTALLNHQPASTPSGCTSGASPAAPSRWAPRFASPATT